MRSAIHELAAGERCVRQEYLRGRCHLNWNVEGGCGCLPNVSPELGPFSILPKVPLQGRERRAGPLAALLVVIEVVVSIEGKLAVLSEVVRSATGRSASPTVHQLKFKPGMRALTNNILFGCGSCRSHVRQANRDCRLASARGYFPSHSQIEIESAPTYAAPYAAWSSSLLCSCFR